MKKSKLKYFFLAFAALLIMKVFYQKESTPVVIKEIVASEGTFAAEEPPEPVSEVKSKTVLPLVKTKKVSKDTVQVEDGTRYKVKVLYPSQHYFEDQTCDLGKNRTDLEPLRQEAFDRLSGEYTHNTYQLSDYLELNLYAEDISEDFEEQLSERIKIIHNNYIQMLGESAEHKIILNLVIASERSDYLHYISYYSEDLDTSLGVYFGGLNIAFVDFQESEERALKTAVHESIHVLNSHLIGRTPHMFNEGMAELYENIDFVDGKAELQLAEDRLLNEAYPVFLFFDDEQWEYLETAQLYYSSWAWITFMHSNEVGIESLVNYMRKEQKDPCSPLSVDESYSVLQERYNIFETDFIDWLESRLSK